jgi:hypothetical protein
VDAPSHAVPLYLRIGDGPEYRVGHVQMHPRQIPALLRSIAAELERLGGAPAENEEHVTEPAERRDEQPRPTPTTDHQADQPGGERAQHAAPRNRQAPPPGRNR